jgi:hypothetical protein
LEEQAWQRVKAADSSIKEKLVTYSVVSAMKEKAKRKVGMGYKRKCNG